MSNKTARMPYAQGNSQQYERLLTHAMRLATIASREFLTKASLAKEAPEGRAKTRKTQRNLYEYKKRLRQVLHDLDNELHAIDGVMVYGRK